MDNLIKGLCNIFSFLVPYRSKKCEGVMKRPSVENRQYYADTADEAIKRDWLNVGNDMRRAMGQPLLSFEECYPEYMDNN